MKTILTLFTLTILVATIHARSVQLLTDQIGSSPRTIALGNIEGMASGSSCVFDNPATLMNSNYALSSMTTELSDTDSTFFTWGASLPFWNGHLGLGMMSVESRNLDKTALGQFDQFYSESKFGTRDSIYLVAYQYMVDKELSVGITAKVVDQDLYTTKGTGYNIDLGALYETPQYRLSGSVKNILRSLNVTYSKDQSELKFPFEACVGGRYALGNIGVLSQVKYIEDGALFLKSVGIDYTPIQEGLTFYLGWKEIAALTTVHNTYGLGIGLDLGTISIAASYELSDFFEQDSRRYLSFEIKL